jgi:hypothetical protein
MWDCVGSLDTSSKVVFKVSAVCYSALLSSVLLPGSSLSLSLFITTR